MSEATLTAAKDLGFDITFLPVLYKHSHMNGSPLNQLQKRFELSIEEYIELHHFIQSKLNHGQNLGICFHSLRAVNKKQIQRILNELGEEHPIHIHISEQQGEIDQCLDIHGKRPVQYLYDNFNVTSHWTLVHATHLIEEELSLIAKSKAVAGICPLTEANLGDGVFPLPEFIHQKGMFSIGSDSHIAIDPFLELQTFEYSQRLINQKRNIACNDKIQNVGTFLWNNAIKGGAQSCQLNVNGIEKNQNANWISIDASDPILTGMNPKSILDSAIFAKGHLQKEIYIKGQKWQGINSETQESYKKTLKSLRKL